MIYNHDQRNHDFRQACRRARRQLYESGIKLTPSAIVDRVLQMPAPQYYISHRRAEMQLQRYRANRLPPNTRECTWRLLDELSQRVNTLLAEGRARTLTNAIAMVLCEGNASGFFMTRQYALRCYYRYA